MSKSAFYIYVYKKSQNVKKQRILKFENLILIRDLQLNKQHNKKLNFK